jgi:hypothetical protein
MPSVGKLTHRLTDRQTAIVVSHKEIKPSSPSSHAVHVWELKDRFVSDPKRSWFQKNIHYKEEEAHQGNEKQASNGLKTMPTSPKSQNEKQRQTQRQTQRHRETEFWVYQKRRRSREWGDFGGVQVQMQRYGSHPHMPPRLHCHCSILLIRRTYYSSFFSPISSSSSSSHLLVVVFPASPRNFPFRGGGGRKTLVHAGQTPRQ